MDRFSDKVKIAYLLLVITFGLGVFFYLLDTWGVIRLENYLPFLKDSPPVVAVDEDNITLLERERMAKEEERLAELELKLNEKQAEIQAQLEQLEKDREELSELRRGLELEKQTRVEAEAAEADRGTMIQEMAARIGAMPPAAAIRIVAGWSNPDLVDVFEEMERAAVAEGRQSIVPFLITQMPPDRAAVITTLMMDADAKRLPETTLPDEAPEGGQ